MAVLRDLPSLAAAISSALASKGIAHAISGAVAMAAHGVVRATKDLDVLVHTAQVRLPEVFGIVRELGFSGGDPALLRSLREDGFAELRSGPVRVEIFVPALPYHATIPDRALLVDIAGVRVPVVTIEDLIVLKMLWRRAKDVADVHSLLAAAQDLDAEYVRSTLESILPASDPRHAEIAGWIARRGAR